MCPYPIYLKKNDLYVPCGKCGACLRRSIGDYTIRCQVEWRHSLACYFVTLTYEKDPLQLYKSDLQSYFKRLRKVGFRFSYFALGDYGDTYGRPHYHVIFFAKGYFNPEHLWFQWISGSQVRRRGFVQVSPLSVGRIAYTVRYGYLAKLDWDKSDPRQRPFFLMSRRPAIGSQFLSDAKKRFLRSNDFWYYPDGRYKKALPRYFKNKIFPGKIENLLHAEVYASLSEERRKKIVDEFSRTNPLNPDSKWIERLQRNADNYLSQLRIQKKLKNKLL